MKSRLRSRKPFLVNLDSARHVREASGCLFRIRNNADTTERPFAQNVKLLLSPTERAR